MIKLRKANRIVRVTENELDRYLANGYEKVEKEIQPSVKVADEPVFEAESITVAEPIATPKKRRKSN